MYTRTSILGWKQSTLFKKTFSMDVDIEFIGVWDTVCSVGLFPRRLPFTASNTSVKTFRHAVSLDERRAKFRANLYNRPQKSDKRLGTQPGDMPKAGRGMDQAVVDGVDKCVGTSGESEVRSKEARPPPLEKKRRSSILSRFSSSSKRAEEERYAKEMERQFSEQEPQLETNVLEVWFAGCHCGTSFSVCKDPLSTRLDVGGGSVSNETRHNLARIPLRWMIRQCFLANTGIRFHPELLRGAGIDPASLHPVVQERPEPLYWSPTTTTPNSTVQVGWPTEEEEDLADALSPIYDQLSLKKGWWSLEYVPMRHRVQLADDSWAMETRCAHINARASSKQPDHVYSMNRGRGRIIPLQEFGFNVHRSVKIRMEAKDLVGGGKYVARAKFDAEPTWVS